MAQVALQRTDDRTEALRDIVVEILGAEEPRRQLAAEMSGLGIRYALGGDHLLVGRRMLTSIWSRLTARCVHTAFCIVLGQCSSILVRPESSTLIHGQIEFNCSMRNILGVGTFPRLGP